MCELYYHCSWGLEAYKAAKKSHEPLRQKKKYILRNSERNSSNMIRIIRLEDSSLYYQTLITKCILYLKKKKEQKHRKGIRTWYQESSEPSVHQNIVTRRHLPCALCHFIANKRNLDESFKGKVKKGLIFRVVGTTHRSLGQCASYALAVKRREFWTSKSL